MIQEDPSQILMQGSEIWNAWRERNRGPVSFASPHWYDRPGEGGIQVKAGWRADIAGNRSTRMDTPEKANVLGGRFKLPAPDARVVAKAR
jgi:hypothetical protein